MAGKAHLWCTCRVGQVAEAAAQDKESLEAAGKAGAEGDEDEMVVKGEVQILDESNFERLTQVATGATTGDWFISESPEAVPCVALCLVE